MVLQDANELATRLADHGPLLVPAVAAARRRDSLLQAKKIPCHGSVNLVESTGYRRGDAVVGCR